MRDIKTIMSWLEGLAEPDWRMFHSDSEVQTIAKETLDLLKEQDTEIICIRAENRRIFSENIRLNRLLKEQEAKKGHWIVLEFCANEGIYCSECHMKIFDRTTKPKKKLSQYCPHCGSRNDQFFRDGEVVFR